MRVCRNSHKLKITLATGSCSEGDFDKKGILTHTSILYIIIVLFLLLQLLSLCICSLPY